MVNKISFSEEKISIEGIWNWYEDQKEALRQFRQKVNDSLVNKTIATNLKFYSFTSEEVNKYFEESEIELEHLVCFNLISATEALLRVNFYKKVYDKDKSEIGRVFRKIHKDKGNKSSLETDIVENWKLHSPTLKKHFSDFLSLLNYRHWLAHGRYWEPKLGRRFSAIYTFDVANVLFKIVS